MKPEPFTQEQFNEKAVADREAIFRDQEPLAGPLTLKDALARVLKYNLDQRAKMMEEALALGQIDLDRYSLLPKVAANAGYTNKSESYATISRDAKTQVTESGQSDLFGGSRQLDR